jgi:hypothetical protein
VVEAAEVGRRAEASPSQHGLGVDHHLGRLGRLARSQHGAQRLEALPALVRRDELAPLDFGLFPRHA